MAEQSYPDSALPGASVEMRAGDRPFLVCGSYGKGHVAVCTSTTFGEGEPALFEVSEWPELMAMIIR